MSNFVLLDLLGHEPHQEEETSCKAGLLSSRPDEVVQDRGEVQIRIHAGWYIGQSGRYLSHSSPDVCACTSTVAGREQCLRSGPRAREARPVPYQSIQLRSIAKPSLVRDPITWAWEPRLGTGPNEKLEFRIVLELLEIFSSGLSCHSPFYLTRSRSHAYQNYNIRLTEELQSLFQFNPQLGSEIVPLLLGFFDRRSHFPSRSPRRCDDRSRTSRQ